MGSHPMEHANETIPFSPNFCMGGIPPRCGEARVARFQMLGKLLVLHGSWHKINHYGRPRNRWQDTRVSVSRKLSS